jgi:hypothetical protein
MHFFMRPHLPNVVSGQQPFQLLRVDRDHALVMPSRPAEPILLQTFVPQSETRLVPVQHFHPRSVAIAEQKQVRTKDIKSHLLRYNRCQPVDRFPKVDLIPMQVDPCE